MQWCAIYTRVSTDKQEDSLENQVVYAKAFIARLLGDEFQSRDDLIYQDPDVSGYSTRWYDRPAIQQALTDAADGKYHVLVFKELSRISRDQDEHREIVGSFRAYGVRLIGINDSLDSDNDSSMDFLPLRSWLAEMESKRISSRVSSGKKSTARRGLWASEAPIGYQLNTHTKRLDIDPEHAPTVARIFAMYTTERCGTFKIAEQLNSEGVYSKYGNPWSRGTVTRVLRNRAYVGDTVYGKTQNELQRRYLRERGYEKLLRRKPVAEQDWVVVADTHPPLVDRPTFDQAQALLAQRSKHSVRRARWPLSGILRCGRCGVNMVCQRRSVRNKAGHPVEYRYYSCGKAFKFGRSACNQQSIPAEQLEQQVLSQIMRLFQPYRAAVHVSPDETRQRQSTQRRAALAREQRQTQRALERLFLSDTLPRDMFLLLQQKYVQNVTRIEAELRELDDVSVGTSDTVDWRQLAGEVWDEWLGGLRAADTERLQNLFQELLHDITLVDRQITSVTFRYGLE